MSPQIFLFHLNYLLITCNFHFNNSFISFLFYFSSVSSAFFQWNKNETKRHIHKINTKYPCLSLSLYSLSCHGIVSAISSIHWFANSLQHSPFSLSPPKTIISSPLNERLFHIHTPHSNSSTTVATNPKVINHQRHCHTANQASAAAELPPQSDTLPSSPPTISAISSLSLSPSLFLNSF